MNNNNLIQFVQQGFRITVGATASFMETLQDPQKRADTLTQIQTEMSQKTQEWAEKGEITEQEAKAFVDNLLSQRGWQKNPMSTQTPPSNSPRTNTDDNISSGLQELTAEIIALKQELEAYRQSEDNN